MKTSEVLDTAADLIEKRGWTTGEDLDPWGHDDDSSPICLEGGIHAAIGGGTFCMSDDLNTCAAGMAVREFLGERLALNDPLYCFNDETGRTAAEVIEVLRAAAVIEAAKENAEARQSVTA